MYLIWTLCSCMTWRAIGIHNMCRTAPSAPVTIFCRKQLTIGHVQSRPISLSFHSFTRETNEETCPLAFQSLVTTLHFLQSSQSMEWQHPPFLLKFPCCFPMNQFHRRMLWFYVEDRMVLSLTCTPLQLVQWGQRWQTMQYLDPESPTRLVLLT